MTAGPGETEPPCPAVALAEARVTAVEDYEVITWEGAAGDDLLDGLALLRQPMSTDAPAGGLFCRR